MLLTIHDFICDVMAQSELEMCVRECMKIRFHCMLLLLVALTNVHAKRSITYDFPGSNCGYRPREIDGIVLQSSRSMLYANSACVMRFESDDDFFTTKKLMLNFPRFNITDCSVTLKLFYASDANGRPDVQLDCRTPRPTVLYSVGRYLTLRLDKMTNTGYDFEIVITTFKYGAYCKEFHCRNDKCIDRDLMCDGVDHCFDSTDELGCYGHIPHGEHIQVRSRLWWIFSTSVVLISVTSAVCLAGVCIFRRRRRYHAASQGQVIRLQPQSVPQQPCHLQQQQQSQPFYPPPQPLPSQPPPAYSKPLQPYSAGPEGPYPVGPQAYYPGTYPVQAPAYPELPCAYPSQPSGNPTNPSGYPGQLFGGYQAYGSVPPAAPGYQP